MTPRRVVSLVPSLTETLFALGVGETVVGITDFCIFPEGLDLPRVGGTKNPRVDDIRALAPDLVHMNFEENLEKHAKQIEAFTRVVVTEPKTIDDVAALFEQLGEIHDARERASELIAELTDSRKIAAQRFTFAVHEHPETRRPDDNVALRTARRETRIVTVLLHVHR